MSIQKQYLWTIFRTSPYPELLNTSSYFLHQERHVFITKEKQHQLAQPRPTCWFIMYSKILIKVFHLRNLRNVTSRILILRRHFRPKKVKLRKKRTPGLFELFCLEDGMRYFVIFFFAFHFDRVPRITRCFYKRNKRYVENRI